MMEIYRNLFVGSQEEYEAIESELKEQKNCFVLHAAKEPYHRNFVGYTGRACDKDHPEYLKAVRGNEMALNLVDAKEAKYFNFDLIKDTITQALYLLLMQRKVYIHCNQGESRAPGIAMLMLLGLHIISENYDDAKAQFTSIYPRFSPGEGMEAFLKNNWSTFVEYFSEKEEVVIDPDKVIDVK